MRRLLSRLWSAIVQDCPANLDACETCREPYCNVSQYLACQGRVVAAPTCPCRETVPVRVTIPAGLSHTGEARAAVKPLDKCIAPTVVALNRAGLRTTGSCCGHGGAAEILLENGGRLTMPSPRAMAGRRP